MPDTVVRGCLDEKRLVRLTGRAWFCFSKAHINYFGSAGGGGAGGALGVLAPAPPPSPAELDGLLSQPAPTVANERTITRSKERRIGSPRIIDD
jgi:hypothetical protein